MGTKFDVTSPKKSILVSLALFFGRRMIFAVSAVYLGELLWAQLAISISVSLVVLGFILDVNPLESPFANQVEFMNELTILILTYGQLHFTDYMPEPESRRIVGVLYIAVILLNVGVHLIILISDTSIKGKFVLRRCYFWCKFKWRRLKIW